MSEWRYDAGVWRWRASAEAYYKAEFKGATWYAMVGRPRMFPARLGGFATANEAKAACIEHWREKACTQTSV